jgi:hypothetical protein
MMVNALDLETSTMAQIDVHVGVVLAVSDSNGGIIVCKHTGIDQQYEEIQQFQCQRDREAASILRDALDNCTVSGQHL